MGAVQCVCCLGLTAFEYFTLIYAKTVEEIFAAVVVCFQFHYEWKNHAISAWFFLAVASCTLGLRVATPILYRYSAVNHISPRLSVVKLTAALRQHLYFFCIYRILYFNTTERDLFIRLPFIFSGFPRGSGTL